MGCNQREVGSRIGKGRGRTNSVQEGAIDLQNGTGVEGNSYPCIKRHYSCKGFLLLKTHLLIILYFLHNNVLILYIFLPCRLKIKPGEGVMNVHLFLGLSAWLRTTSTYICTYCICLSF